MKNHKHSKKYTFKNKALKSKKRIRKSKKSKRLRRKTRKQRGGFLSSVKNLLNNQMNANQHNAANNISGKQVLLNTMCDQVDDASLQNAPKLSGIVNSLCIENAKSNAMNASMSGGQQNTANNVGGNFGNLGMANLGGGVLGMVVKAATYPARMGLNVIQNVTGFNKGQNMGNMSGGHQEYVAGDVQHNINMIKENNKKIKNLKLVPSHLLDPTVYENIQGLNSLDLTN